MLDSGTVQSLRHDHIVAYRLDGALFFGAVQRFLTELAAVDNVKVVILRLPELQMLDASGAQALGDVIDELERRHVTVLLKGPRPEHLRILREVGAIARLAHENHLFDDLDDAIAHARRHVNRTHDDADNTDANVDSVDEASAPPSTRAANNVTTVQASR